MNAELNKKMIEVRCPQCASEHKQKIANLIVFEKSASYKVTNDIDENALSSVQFKCSKCKALVYLNIYK